MSNRKAMAIMTGLVVFVWAVTFALEYAGIPHVRKAALVATIALCLCGFGALLHFLGKRIR